MWLTEQRARWDSEWCTDHLGTHAKTGLALGTIAGQAGIRTTVKTQRWATLSKENRIH